LRGSAVHFILRFLDFSFSSFPKVDHSFSSVQGGTDLFVRHYETLEFNVEVFVLSLEHMAVVVESIDFTLDIIVSLQEVVVAESQVVLFLAGDEKLVFDVTHSLLSLVQLGLKFSVSNILAFSLSLEVGLVGELAVKVSLERLVFNQKS
jgi:hypothetical protein